MTTIERSKRIFGLTFSVFVNSELFYTISLKINLSLSLSKRKAYINALFNREPFEIVQYFGLCAPRIFHTFSHSSSI